MVVRTVVLAMIVAAWALITATPIGAQVNNYVVGPQDVLSIAVFDQLDLGGKFAVEADGTFTFPLVGRLKAGGLTLRQVEETLRKELANGFFKNPQVSVSIEQYRSQRVFVVGEVRTPGTYAMTGDMTLIEALARAGSANESAGAEALIVRLRAGAVADGPLVPTSDTKSLDDRAEVIRVDIKELQSGKLSQNVALRDNDTIFVPRAELIYVSGQVRNPGSYALKKGMTVQQALAVAGGATDRGATGRITAKRVKNGASVEFKLKLEDLVEPGDTIVVPERFF